MRRNPSVCRRWIFKNVFISLLFFSYICSIPVDKISCKKFQLFGYAIYFWQILFKELSVLYNRLRCFDFLSRLPEVNYLIDREMLEARYRMTYIEICLKSYTVCFFSYRDTDEGDPSNYPWSALASLLFSLFIDFWLCVTVCVAYTYKFSSCI